MTENENKGENTNTKPLEITQDKIINPQEYAAEGLQKEPVKSPSVEGDKKTVKTEQPTPPTPTTSEAPTEYKNHVLAKAVNQFAPLIINRLILKCPDCEKVTQEEIEATGLGEALAWCADKYLPQVPTNTPAAALIASSFAVAGLVAMKHPKVKQYLEGIEQQVGA